MIIAITGTPCTGKTMVAKILAEVLGYEYISLNDLAKHHSLYSGFDRKRQAEIVDIESIRENIVVNDAVLDAHYSHDMNPDVIFVLRTNPKELRERMVHRGWGDEKIEENIESEIMEVIFSESIETRKPTFQIDTTGKEPEDCVMEILEILKNHRFKI